MDMMTAHKIDIETAYIYYMWDEHNNGKKNVKYLLTLYMHIFELHPISIGHAKRVISWIDESE